MTSALGWLIVAVIFFIIEILTPMFLFSLFSLAVFIVSIFAFFFPQIFYVHIVIFVFLSFIFIIFIRKIFLRYFIKDDKNGAKTNANSMIGRKCRVIETIDNKQNTGVTEIDGIRWRTLSDNNEIFEVGKFVQIVSVNGSKLKVRKTDEE